MNNKKLQVALSKLLKIDEKVFETATDSAEGDESILKEYTDKFTSYSADELAKLLSNSNKQFLEKADFDINDVPKNLYSKIKAAAFEKFEKDLAKKHEIGEYKSLEDLIQKLTEKSNDGKGKEPDKDLLKQIEVLKQSVVEKEEALKTLGEKAISDAINAEFEAALNELPLDYDDETLPKQRKLMASAFLSEHKIIKKADKTVVLNSKGEPVLDKLADPEKIQNVVKSFADGYGFKFKADDEGGRGGSSSGASKGTKNYKGKTWEQVMVAEGLEPNTEASDKAFAEWKAENPTK